MIQTVFISRKLRPDSPLMIWAIKNGIKLIDFPLIKIEPIRNQEIPTSDWIFFLSPIGVNTYFDNYALKAEKIAVYGLGTNRELDKRGYKANFIGDNAKSSEKIGEAFFQFISPTEVVLFPVSEISRRSIVKQNITNLCHEVVIYRNLPVSKHLGKIDIAILTSPSNIDAYVESNGTKDTKFIVLGETSLSHFNEKKIDTEILMANASTEEAIIPIVRRLGLS